MHISDQYGPVSKGIQGMTLPALTSPSDAWTEGKRQKELNERGAYLHRFQNQSSCQSMIAAVQKISEDNICTPCTLVGPSFCRTYNHHVWEGCAALLFSPQMPIALAYKGDIYSNRLSAEPNLNHSKYKSPNLNRAKSLELFSEAVRTTFNGYGPTSSAFKGRRAKKLNLVTSATHHAAKIQEMEKRANLYFTLPENLSCYKLDTSSKDLLLQLSDCHKDFNLQEKPPLKTKVEVIAFIDLVTSIKPALLPFLAACRIKISNFSNDAAVRLYLANAAVNGHKQPHERSYAEFIQWQFNNSQTGSNFHIFSDKSTNLTPNEVLGMPSSENLVGLVIDPSTSLSFDQALNTLEYLKKNAKSGWQEVAKNIPPFTHLVAHMDEGTILQLGWSKMIIPYSTKGLQDYCSSNKVTAIDGIQFSPDYFLLLHRLASNSVLVFSKEYKTVDILCLKPNTIANFASIRSSQGKPLLYEAISLPNIREETLRLFFHLDRIGAGNSTNVKTALNNPKKIAKNTILLDGLNSMNAVQLDEDLNSLLSMQINRIERSLYQTSKNHRTIKYRGGFKDQGTFEYNSRLGSLSLREGKREYGNSVRMAGLFKPTGDMKGGGAELEYGIRHDKETCKFGNFSEAISPLSLSRQFSTLRNQHYYQLSFGAQAPLFNINFSKMQFVRLYLEWQAAPGMSSLKLQLRNRDWADDLGQVMEQPLQALTLLSNTVKTLNKIPDDWLKSGIVCLATLRFACLSQQMSASMLNSYHSLQNPLHKETALKLEEQFKQIVAASDAAIAKLAPQYQTLDPNCNDLKDCLTQLPPAIGHAIQEYLADLLGMSFPNSPLAILLPITLSAPTTANTSTTFASPTPTPRPSSVITPKTSKKTFVEKLMIRFKRAFKL